MNRSKKSNVGKGKSIGKTIFKYIGDSRIASRFETGENFTVRPAGTQRFKGSGNRGGMVGKIQEDG